MPQKAVCQNIVAAASGIASVIDLAARRAFLPITFQNNYRKRTNASWRLISR